MSASTASTVSELSPEKSENKQIGLEVAKGHHIERGKFDHVRIKSLIQRLEQNQPISQDP